MSADTKQNRPKARLAKGFRDIGPEEMRGVKRMLRTIEEVYESYGFEPVEQPFIEYTDALGKFLPDQDRPNEGVFSFQDDDGQWLSLRYDLTAPLARYVAENQQSLAMPYRSYRQGWVFRNEKPGPGRFRQFMQFDADTVGTANPVADAEVCMMAADTMEALGIPRGQYVMKINNRKILDGVMESIGLGGEPNSGKRLAVMRAIDKLDRLGRGEVARLLGPGRVDESGDITAGAGLSDDQIGIVLTYLTGGSETTVSFESRDQIRDRPLVTVSTFSGYDDSALPEDYDNEMRVERMRRALPNSPAYLAGLDELAEIARLCSRAGYSKHQISVDPSVVRGLEYYTGPVFECELLMEARNEDGQLVRFGSVGGGGRYDDLVARFTGQKVPATGFSVGVSRLYAALKLLGKAEEGGGAQAPVIVLVLDRDRQGDYQRMVSDLRKNGIRAEMYLGTSGMKAQMKYADRRGAPLVIIQGGDEKAKGEVQIKDLRLGAELAKNIESREEYKETRLAQVTVPEANLVAAVKEALGRG